MVNFLKETKYIHLHKNQYGCRRSKRRNQVSRENKGFFIKPRLNFIRLEDYVETITCRSSKTNIPQSFCIKIWTLRIENKNININQVFKKVKLNKFLPRRLGRYSLSKDITACSVLFNVIVNRQTKYNLDIPLSWKRGHFPNPNQKNPNEEIESREEFLKILPFNTMNDIPQSKIISFPTKTYSELILFITFQDLSSFYIISDMGSNDMDMDNEVNLNTLSHLSLKFNNSYEISFRIFDGNKEINNKKFRLRANSWDNIEIEDIVD